MSRDLTSVVETALAADVIEPFFAVDLLFDSPSELYLSLIHISEPTRPY